MYDEQILRLPDMQHEMRIESHVFSPCHVYKDFYLHHCVEVKFLEFHLDANNAEIKQKENKNSVGDCWSP